MNHVVKMMQHNTIQLYYMKIALATGVVLGKIIVYFENQVPVD